MMTTPGSSPTGGSHNPAPGWYPDPQSPSLRWWDGSRWSGSVVPIPETPLPPPPSPVQQQSLPPPIDSHIPSPTPIQAGRNASAAEPSRAAELVRLHWRRLLLDVVLLLLFTLSLVLTFTMLGVIVGAYPTTGIYVRVVIFLPLALGAAYWSWRRSRFYIDLHPDGKAAGVKLRDVLMGVWFVGSVVLAYNAAIDGASRQPSLSGSALQTMLRSNLGAAEGSPARTNTISCPSSKRFFDGDVARCTVKTYADTVEVLVVTVFWEDDDWRLGIDIG